MELDSKNKLEGKKKHWLLLAAVFFCFLALYAVTAQRGVSWQDGGEFQYRIFAGDLRWNSGIARAHPLYVLAASGFAKLFPLAQMFYATNVFSGLGLAIASTLLFALVSRLTGRWLCGFLSAVLFGLSHMPWWQGTAAEVDAWGCAFVISELTVLSFAVGRERPGLWLLLAFINGMHFSVHDVALLSFPVLILACPVKWWPMCAGTWLVGAIPILLLLPQEFQAFGWAGTVRSVLFGHGFEGSALGSSFNVKIVFINFALFAVNFMNPAWVFAVKPLFMMRGKFLILVRWVMFFHVLFFVRYFAPNQAQFSAPVVMLTALWAGLGVSCLKKRSLIALIAVSVLCSTLVPPLILTGVNGGQLFPKRERSLPFRDEARYWLLPWKHNEDSAFRFVKEVGRQLHTGDVLIADSTSTGPLLAARSSGLVMSDWRLVTPWSGETDGELSALTRTNRPRVYVVSPVLGYTSRAVLDAATAGFEQDGVLYRVLQERGSSSAHVRKERK